MKKYCKMFAIICFVASPVLATLAFIVPNGNFAICSVWSVIILLIGAVGLAIAGEIEKHEKTKGEMKSISKVDEVGETTVTITDAVSCLLCGSTSHIDKVKLLYGHMVCTKCYNGFANRRQIAFFLDSIGWQLIVVPIIGFILGVVMVASGASESTIANTVSILWWWLVAVFLCKDGFAGRSPGKLICGVQVIDATTGLPAGIGASSMRNLPLIIPLVPLLVACQLFKGKRTGDGWANTKVIWKKYANNPVFATLAGNKELEK